MALWPTFATKTAWIRNSIRLHYEENVMKNTDKSVNTAIIAVPKLENDSYDWEHRHEEVLRIGRTVDPEIVLIGDSITHFRGGIPEEKIANGLDSWHDVFGEYRTLNLGFGWDRTQNVLWRLEHGEFDGLNPKIVIIHIGTNNLSETENARKNTTVEIVEGIMKICDTVNSRVPDAEIILVGILPRGENPDGPFRDQIAKINKLLAEYTSNGNVFYIDVGDDFLNNEGIIPKDMMSDFCHPTAKGYWILADALKKTMSNLKNLN